MNAWIFLEFWCTLFTCFRNSYIKFISEAIMKHEQTISDFRRCTSLLCCRTPGSWDKLWGWTIEWWGRHQPMVTRWKLVGVSWSWLIVSWWFRAVEWLHFEGSDWRIPENKQAKSITWGTDKCRSQIGKPHGSQKPTPKKTSPSYLLVI